MIKNRSKNDLEDFIKLAIHEDENLNESMVLFGTIASILSYPFVIKIFRLGIEKVNERWIKHHMPDEYKHIDKRNFLSVLKDGSLEDIITEEDLKDAEFKELIKKINTIGSDLAEFLNQFNDKEVTVKPVRSAEDQEKRTHRNKLSRDEIFYQISLVLGAIQYNLAWIFREASECIAEAVSQVLTANNVILTDDQIEKVNKSISKILYVGFVCYMFVLSSPGILSKAGNILQKIIASIKGVKNLKTFFISLQEVMSLFKVIGGVIETTPVVAQFAALEAFQELAEPIINYFQSNIAKKAAHDEVRSGETAKRYSGITKAQAKLMARQGQRAINRSRQPSLRTRQANLKRRRDRKEYTDIHGSQVVDNFLRQYIKMILS